MILVVRVPSETRRVASRLLPPTGRADHPRGLDVPRLPDKPGPRGAETFRDPTDGTLLGEYRSFDTEAHAERWIAQWAQEAAWSAR